MQPNQNYPDHKQRKQILRMWQKIIAMSLQGVDQLLTQRDYKKRNQDILAYIDEDGEKNRALITEEQMCHLDKVGEANNKFGEQLLTINSALLAIVGGFMFGQTDKLQLSVPAKVLIIVMVCSFFVSLFAGLVNFVVISAFWTRQAKARREEVDLLQTLLQSPTVTIGDWANKKTMVSRKRASVSYKIDTRPINTQIAFFTIGASLLLALVIVRVLAAK